MFASPGCKKWDTCAPEVILHAVGGESILLAGIIVFVVMPFYLDSQDIGARRKVSDYLPSPELIGHYCTGKQGALTNNEL